MLTSIVVANHGRDLSRLKWSLPPHVEFIEINLGLERSKQRNIGIKQAKGDIIIWLDSDQALSDGVVEECERMLSMGYISLYIPEIIIADSFFGKIRAFERTFYTGTFIDVPRAILKKWCPEFNEELHGPEDADFGNRLPAVCRGVTKNVLYHYDDVPFFEYCKKKAYYTKSMRKYEELNPNDKCLNMRYRCWDVFVEKGKWKEIIKHPILTCGVIFLLAVRGIIYAKR